jgi:hypothetical protein
MVLAPHDLEELRRSLLKSANKSYENLINQEPGHSDIQYERPAACFARENIERAINNRSEADTACKKTIAAVNGLVQARPADRRQVI